MSTQSTSEDFESIISYEEKFKSTKYIFSTTNKSLNDVIKDCIVVFDTNVLLIPYTLKKQDVSEIEKIYRKLSKNKQLFIPKHVAREFAANKDQKLADLYKAVIDRNITLPTPPEAAIISETDEFKALLNEHSKLEENIKSFNLAIRSLAKSIKQWSWNDPIIQMYSKYFTDEIIVEHELDQASVKNELEKRNKHKIAPGFKDSKKTSNVAGDLIIWLTILELGNKFKKDLIFVSEDRKPDWFHQSNGSAFSPKYELINEYKNASDGKDINILVFSEFLEAFNVPGTLIEEIKKSESATVSIKRFFRKSRRLHIAEIQAEGRDISMCEACGFKFDEGNDISQLHHIIPISQGGSDSASNILVLCPNCHAQQHSI